MTATEPPAPAPARHGTGSLLLPVRAVLFDSDGVLVDSDASVRAAWSRWALEQGTDPDAVYAQVHGRRAADTVAALVPAGGRAEALQRIDRYELEAAGAVTAVAGAVALTSSMPAGAWAVVTSGTRALAGARLSAAGIRPPAVLVTADDVAAGKPAPEGYLAAAAGLGVPAAECLVVEDAAAGVRAARAAGVHAVVGVGERALATDADVVVADLSALTWTAAGLQVGARLR